MIRQLLVGNCYRSRELWIGLDAGVEVFPGCHRRFVLRVGEDCVLAPRKT